ncbi:hypothetical protein [Saccharopolyspora endophytica]|uniref:GntR family transcriptional regulator n=1 Tax=Saccharopolyspora endophytica TaxID=543886 RepID=A0ABS5DKX3_9PSEU|nr:hypothetical protein [Saccharopolyspora endophytica]MBQ0926948.1 hypothetical protein [Saccharopolyspora endophytica]
MRSIPTIQQGDVAYVELHERSLSGALLPGSRPAQHELAAELDMSLTRCGKRCAGSAS